MFTLFAHAGHAHTSEDMTMLDHCLPIIIGAGIIVAILAGIIAYLLAKWEPKKPAAPAKKTAAKKKK